MTESQKNIYSASKQGLGYIYQGRFALYKLLQLAEETILFIEKDDDVDFVDKDGRKSLASLKHKASLDRLTNLDPDFWKSVRIWYNRYIDQNKIESPLRFFLFTTAEVSEKSFLINFLPNSFAEKRDIGNILETIDGELDKTESEKIILVRESLKKLTKEEKEDFFSRIMIFDKSPRITELPQRIIDQHMRMIPKDFRESVFERIEGWWNNLVIRLLAGERETGIYGEELSNKLAAIADEYSPNNLPIEFKGKKPDGEIDPENDPRLFVRQLRVIGLSPERIKSAIYDYYRAFQQRSSWQRIFVLADDEIEKYEETLIDEWKRFKDRLVEDFDEKMAENKLQNVGRDLYNWAEDNATQDNFRIRERVKEPYVTRGSFHILANEQPRPRVYWHPFFLERLSEILTKK